MILFTAHYLYLITNPTNRKQYIGVSKDPNRRMREHFSGNGSKKIAEDLNDSMTFNLLVKGSEQYIYGIESEAISRFNTLDPNGYNIGIGGEGGNISNRKGELNTQARLSESQILEIRELASNNVLHSVLAEQFRVTRENISSIVRGASWANVGGIITSRKTVSSEDIEIFNYLLVKGLTRTLIAKETGWSYQTVYKYTK